MIGGSSTCISGFNFVLSFTRTDPQRWDISFRARWYMASLDPDGTYCDRLKRKNPNYKFTGFGLFKDILGHPSIEVIPNRTATTAHEMFEI